MTPMTTLPPRASKSPVAPQQCRLARAIDLLGERWTLLILRAALYGVRRFDDFQDELDCPRSVLSGRLKKLTDAGLIARQPYREPGRRQRHEYVLTEAGRALQPTLIALTQWGDEYLGGGEPGPIGFADAKTRGAVRVGFVDETGREVPPERLRVKLRKS